MHSHTQAPKRAQSTNNGYNWESSTHYIHCHSSYPSARQLVGHQLADAHGRARIKSLAHLKGRCEQFAGCERPSIGIAMAVTDRFSPAVAEQKGLVKFSRVVSPAQRRKLPRRGGPC